MRASAVPPCFLLMYLLFFLGMKLYIWLQASRVAQMEIGALQRHPVSYKPEIIKKKSEAYLLKNYW